MVRQGKNRRDQAEKNESIPELFSSEKNSIHSFVKPTEPLAQSRLELLKKANEHLLSQQYELKRQAVLLEKVFDAVTDPVIALRAGTVVRANRQGSKLLEKDDSFLKKLLEDLAPAREIRHGPRLYRIQDVQPVHFNDKPTQLLTLRDLSHEEFLNRQKRKSRENERTRTLKELEDRLGKDVESIRSRLSAITRGSSSAHPQFERLSELVHEIVGASRVATFAQETKIRSGLVFKQSLHFLATDYTTNFGYPVEIWIDGLPKLKNDSDWSELFLVLQEALRNSWRHSGGTNASLTLSPFGIRLSDDGKGLDEECFKKGGIGLRSIRERCRDIGLAARILPSPQNGWEFTLEAEEIQ